MVICYVINAMSSKRMSSTLFIFSYDDVSTKFYIIINEYAQVINWVRVSRPWRAIRRPVTCLQSAQVRMRSVTKFQTSIDNFDWPNLTSIVLRRFYLNFNCGSRNFGQLILTLVVAQTFLSTFNCQFQELISTEINFSRGSSLLLNFQSWSSNFGRQVRSTELVTFLAIWQFHVFFKTQNR